MSMERVLNQQRHYAAVVQAHLLSHTPPAETNPEIDRLVTEIIGRVADRWTMLVLEALDEHGGEHGELRFTRLAELLEGISQKMLTKTLRQMERDGLLRRTVHPVVPPHVDYRLTELGASLGAAFCGVWMWAEKHHDEIVKARERFDAVPAPGVPKPRVAV
jgi:DNA-binding HxlR family transcriptional regulator